MFRNTFPQQRAGSQDLRCVKAKRFLKLEDDTEMNYWELRAKIKDLHYSENLLIGWKYVGDMDDQDQFQARQMFLNFILRFGILVGQREESNQQ